MSNRISGWPARKRLLGVLLAGILGIAWSPAGLRAQQTGVPNPVIDTNILHTGWFPSVLQPYTAPMVPPVRLSNSPRLSSLIENGKLRLSLQDTIALALENNLDIAVARFTEAYAQTDLLRTKSGGGFRGINPALFGGVTAFAGGSGAGSSAGTGSAGGLTGGGGAINTGSVTCCDPVAGVNFGWDFNTSPLNYTVVSGVPLVTTQTSNVTTYFAKGFMTGTSMVVAMSGNRQSTTSLNTLFNPQVPTGLTIGFNQKLLNGFGYRANAKYLRIAKNDVHLADSTFKQQVITTVTNVLNLYYTLLYDRENGRVAEQALAYAQKLLADNKRQVEIGTLAPIEVVRAESEVAARQQDLIVAQTTYLQQQEMLKTAISKHVDPQLASVQIDATDQLPSPSTGDIPPLEQALKEAEANRPEVRQAELNIRNQDITVQAARNAMLPSLDIFATYAPTGLSGNSLVCPSGYSLTSNVCQGAGGATIAPAVVSGGLFQSMTQMFHGSYPNYSFGATLQIPIRNRAARADMATALLQVRQLRVQLQQTKNQVDQDVRNAEIAVTQAKAQIAAAVKATTLAAETLDAQQKKYLRGEATVFLVIQAERDLVTAQGTEAQARANYAKALTQFGQATGTTLSRNHIEVSEALSGQVNRNPNIPGTPVTPSSNPENHLHRW